MVSYLPLPTPLTETHRLLSPKNCERHLKTCESTSFRSQNRLPNCGLSPWFDVQARAIPGYRCRFVISLGHEVVGIGAFMDIGSSRRESRERVKSLW